MELSAYLYALLPVLPLLLDFSGNWKLWVQLFREKGLRLSYHIHPPCFMCVCELVQALSF